MGTLLFEGPVCLANGLRPNCTRRKLAFNRFSHRRSPLSQPLVGNKKARQRRLGPLSGAATRVASGECFCTGAPPFPTPTHRGTSPQNTCHSQSGTRQTYSTSMAKCHPAHLRSLYTPNTVPRTGLARHTKARPQAGFRGSTGSASGTRGRAALPADRSARPASLVLQRQCPGMLPAADDTC